MVVSRRGFMAGVGASLLAAPFVRVLSGTARASDHSGARRLLIFFSPNGTVPHRWRPSGVGAGYSFAAGSVLEPLGRMRELLLPISGLDFHNATNHEGGMRAMLTNGGGLESESRGQSLDQFVASHIGGDTRFPSLELGVQTSLWGGSSQTRMSYAGPGSFVTPDDSPSNVYERLFGGLGGAGARLLARRKSVIDIARTELVDLRGRLGRAEQIKLEAHIEALRTVEKAITPADTCDAPAAPANLPPRDNDAFPDLLDAQMRLAVTALGCGMTRVATVQCAHTIAPTVCSWLGVGEGHHTLSHSDDGNTEGVEAFIKTERWFAEQFGALIDLVRAQPDPDHPEGDGNLLDSTVVLWCKEMGDSRLHNCLSVPMVLAGDGGGAFQTGRHLDLGGIPHAHLLISVCHALGINVDTFGDPAAGTGGIGELAG